MALANSISPSFWLRDAQFDSWFILGIPLIAISAGFLVMGNSALFPPILFANLWLLGYHHVVSTFTRLVFDKSSFQQHKNLVLHLPIVVVGAVSALVYFGGLWLVPTIYLYWQWYHYARQSEGISKAFAGRARDKDRGNLLVTRVAFYLVPMACMTVASSRSPGTFLGMPIRTLDVSWEVASALGLIAIVFFALWINEQVRAYRNNNLSLPYLLYMLSHFVIFYFAYVYMPVLEHGWLVINVWHNAQYILFVWLFNNRRFGGEHTEQHGFLSYISQDGKLFTYLATCLALSTAMYLLFLMPVSDYLSESLLVGSTVGALIVYQSVNFHHYIVDSRIWKLSRKPMKQTLGLS